MAGTTRVSTGVSKSTLPLKYGERITCMHAHTCTKQSKEPHQGLGGLALTASLLHLSPLNAFASHMGLFGS